MPRFKWEIDLPSSKKTPIEQIFQEVVKREMTREERKVLLAKRRKLRATKRARAGQDQVGG
jgi:hypothetical protein